MFQNESSCNGSDRIRYSGKCESPFDISTMTSSFVIVFGHGCSGCAGSLMRRLTTKHIFGCEYQGMTTLGQMEALRSGHAHESSGANKRLIALCEPLATAASSRANCSMHLVERTEHHGPRLGDLVCITQALGACAKSTPHAVLGLVYCYSLRVPWILEQPVISQFEVAP